MLELNLNIIHIILIGAIINGLIYCILLLRKKENKKANRFLSLVIFSLCFTLTTPIVIHLQLFEVYTWLKFLPFWLILWTGPSFYFYSRSLTNPNFIFTKNHLWHFSLIILNYVPHLYHVFISDMDAYPILYFLITSTGIYAIIAICIYTYFSYRGISKYQKSIINNLSTIDEIKLSWLKQVIIVLFFSFLLIFIILALVFMSDYNEPDVFLSQYLEIIPLIISLIIYWLSIRGYLQPQTVMVVDTTTYETTDNKDYSLITEQLLQVMKQDKLYRNPDLTLNLLSERTQLSEREISISLNQHLGKNFYTFINEFRVEDVKERLSNIENKNLNILSIAYDSGFNSKATFNRIFKEYTGNPPSFYRPNK